jgi:hypothetical protein
MKATSIALAGALILGGAAALRGQEAATNPSLERMRSVLRRTPLKLTMAEPEATFKIEIHAIHPMHEIFEKPAWQLDPVGWQPPGVGLDLSLFFGYISRAKRAHDVRVAQVSVQRAIADYCATQPNPETIQICSTSRAIR